jgi:hypothetical protein
MSSYAHLVAVHPPPREERVGHRDGRLTAEGRVDPGHQVLNPVAGEDLGEGPGRSRDIVDDGRAQRGPNLGSGGEPRVQEAVRLLGPPFSLV